MGLNIHVPIGKFVAKSLEISFFRKKFGNRVKREFFRIFKFLWCTSICNVKIQFLLKLRLKILTFVEFPSFFVIISLQGHWQEFTKIAVGTIHKKSCNFSKAGSLQIFAFFAYMMHLKVWGSRKIFSMCEIENAAGGAPPKIGLREPIFTWINFRGFFGHVT